MNRLTFGFVLLLWAQSFGQKVPSVACSASQYVKGDGSCGDGGAGGLPSGVVVMVASGTCPSGYTEVSALDGKMPLGTLDSHADVGGTGGANDITPAGTNSGTAVSDHASHTHTYTDVVNHVHPYCSQTATTGGASSYEHGAIDASSAATECSMLTNNPSGGVATGTTAGPGATLTHTVSTQPTFAGTQFDNRSAYVKVIYCQKD